MRRTAAHRDDLHKRFTCQRYRTLLARSGKVERLVLHDRAAMVRFTVAFAGGSGRNVQDLLEALHFLMTATRFEAGCRGCSTWAEPDLTVHYVEEWETEADMRRRVRSTRFTSVLAVLESARESPQVQFDFVTRTRGLDYVAEIRGGALN